MSVTRKELEKLLTKNDTLSQSKLNYVMQTMPHALLADHLVSLIRRFQCSTIGVVVLMALCFGWCIELAIEDDNFSSSIVMVFGFIRGLTWIRNIRDRERTSNRLLSTLHDIRALPNVLKLDRVEYWQREATTILNVATVEGWPSSMFALEKSRLCRRVVKLLEEFSQRKDTLISDTEADMAIAAARFLAARQPVVSQTVLHRVATAPVPEVGSSNLCLVRETAQSLVGNRVSPNRPETTLQAVGRR